MILEFCPDGNLEDIVSKRGPLGEGEALEIAYQLARGLQFIAKKKVVHRDIKPDNVFIKKEGVYTLYKLGDFGFAVKKQMNEEIVGTPIFMSPELFREETYGSEVDVWAYGLLVHYMLFKEHYFMENTENKVKKKVLETRYTLSPQQRAKLSPATVDLLTRSLEFDKNKRLHSEELASHPAFAGVREKVELLVREVTHRNELT
jgi:serine/threonine protein kinase